MVSIADSISELIFSISLNWPIFREGSIREPFFPDDPFGDPFFTEWPFCDPLFDDLPLMEEGVCLRFAFSVSRGVPVETFSFVGLS